MKILIMAQHYWPEEVSGAVLATELAEDLVHRGHRVTFVTSAPSYPYGKVFAGFQNKWRKKEIHNGVCVIRTWSYISPSKKFWPRILNYGTFSATALFGALQAEKPDVIFSYSPPLPLGIAAWIVSKLRKIPWVMRIEDLYPDTAVAAGLLTNRFVINLFYWLEKFLYRRADHISLVSESFRKNLLKKGIADQKLSVTPVWADPGAIQPMEKDNSFRKEHDLTGRFVVMYSGNLGNTSSLEDLLDAAKLLISHPDIKFMIVGEGVKKAALERFTEENRLDNVCFLPYQPRERLSEMLSAADIGVVTLNNQLAHTSLPSKTFAIMASARPIFAITPEDSEVAVVVHRSVCGINVPPHSPQQAADEIVRLSRLNSDLPQMGDRGREALLKDYSRNVCIEEIESVIKRAAS